MEPEQARDRAAYGSIPAALVIIVQSIQLAFLLLKLFSWYPIVLATSYENRPGWDQIDEQEPFSSSWVSLSRHGASFESRPKRRLMHEKCTFILFSASQRHSAWDIRWEKSRTSKPLLY